MADDPSVQSFGEPTQPTTGPVGPGGAPLAEWWKRLVAAIIDGFIIGIPANIIGGILFSGMFAASAPRIDPNTGQLVGGNAGFMAGFLAAWGAFVLMYLILTAAYYIYLHSSRGQTVGKMAMKIKVVDMQTGELIPYGRAGIRWVVQQVLALLCGIGALVDGLWPLWDQKRQALHDKPANTVVIDVA